MMKKFQNLISYIPAEYKADFYYTISGENLFKMMISSIAVIILESVIFFFFKDEIFNTNDLVLSAIIFNIIVLPVLYFSYIKADSIKFHIDKIIQTIFILGMLIFACGMSLIPQNRFASINVYIMVVFAVSALIYFHPIKYFFLLFSIYCAFYFLLPLYQSDQGAVTILRLNAFAMNIFAWILSRMVFNTRIHTYIDKKIIEEKNIKLKNMAVRDSMTDLLNHDYSYKKLKDEIIRAGENDFPLSLIMLDIDNFKQINDTYGHTSGDEIIIGVAKIILSTCRNIDFVGRYGGEEFIVIFPGMRFKDALMVGERIRKNIENSNFYEDIHVTISGGISEYTGGTAEELIKQTDEKLYKAKANGRNRFEG